MFSLPLILLFFFFFNDTATTEIYTLSLHDALPISVRYSEAIEVAELTPLRDRSRSAIEMICVRSEEHTSELQSLTNLVCRLLLEKKKKKNTNNIKKKQKKCNKNTELTTTSKKIQHR